MISKLKLKKFENSKIKGEKLHDYSLCIFKILPLTTSSKL